VNVVAVVVVVAFALACRGATEQAGAQRPAVPVVVAAAETRDVPLRLRAVGQVEPVSTVQVRPQASGTLKEAAFEEGREVRTGDLLFRIDDRPYLAALHQAQGALARDEAQLAAAALDATRQENLLKKQYVSQGDREKAEALADSYRAAVRADRAAVEAASVQLGYCTIRSPIDGRTGPLLVKPGNVVALPGAPVLVTIHQLRPINVTFNVPESRLPDLRARMAAGAIDVLASPEGDPGEPASGRLTFMSNEVDRATGTIQVKATFENADGRLWPGQFVRVTALLGVIAGATVVPSSAIQDGQQGSYAYVVKQDNTAELRKVKAGPAEDGLAVVESGLSPGERVVVDGQVRVAPGAAVEARAPGQAGPAGPR